MDVVAVDVPPLLLRRAADAVEEGERPRRLVAFFETYGHAPAQLRAAQFRRDQFESDLHTQQVAWSDLGHSRRTETTQHALHGADLFEDSYMDYYM